MAELEATTTEGLARAALDACRARGWRIATADLCTGGLIAGALTEIAGSSDVVEGGVVSYSNAAKCALLGVPAALFEGAGAVSTEVARAMAEGALERFPAAFLAVSVTGVAGPGGGSAQKPVGLVQFALAGRDGGIEAWHEIFPGDRASVRLATVRSALRRIVERAGAGLGTAAC